jgi:hypothetical protein
MQDGGIPSTVPVIKSNGTPLQSSSCSTYERRMESIIKALEPDMENSDTRRE